MMASASRTDPARGQALELIVGLAHLNKGKDVPEDAALAGICFAWNRVLAPIPTEHLEASFDAASRTDKGQGLMPPALILEAWEAIRPSVEARPLPDSCYRRPDDCSFEAYLTNVRAHGTPEQKATAERLARVLKKPGLDKRFVKLAEIG